MGLRPRASWTLALLAQMGSLQAGEALTIIADEIRAQLAESEKAAADAEADAVKRTETSHAAASTPKRANSKSPTPSKASTSVTAA